MADSNEIWSQFCPTNCSLYQFNTTLEADTYNSTTNEDLYYKTFLDGFRFWILRVLVPIVVVIGVLGNGVTVIVLSRKSMRSSTNTYLTALAISDLLYLIFVFTLSLEHYPNIHDEHYYFYWLYRPYGLWLTDATTSTSIWLTVTFTVERYIAVCHPLHGKMLCTESRARAAIIMVYALCFLATATTSFEWLTACKCKLNGNAAEPYVYLSQSALGKNETYKTIFYQFWSISCVFLPVILLAVFNTFLILAVHRSSRTRRQMTQRDNSVNTQRLENKITITLIAVVILFLICQIPTAVLLIYESLRSPEISQKKQMIILMMNNVSNFLVVINAAANFLLYTALSAKYRRTLLNMLCKRCYKHKSPGHSTATTQDFSRGTSTAMTVIRDPRERTRSTKSSRSISTYYPGNGEIVRQTTDFM